MSFTFCHDGRCYRLDTEDGEVHCEPISPQPKEQDMEPEDES